jgi:hypothetical protein
MPSRFLDGQVLRRLSGLQRSSPLITPIGFLATRSGYSPSPLRGNPTSRRVSAELTIERSAARDRPATALAASGLALELVVGLPDSAPDAALSDRKLAGNVSRLASSGN